MGLIIMLMSQPVIVGINIQVVMMVLTLILRPRQMAMTNTQDPMT